MDVLLCKTKLIFQHPMHFLRLITFVIIILELTFASLGSPCSKNSDCCGKFFCCPVKCILFEWFKCFPYQGNRQSSPGYDWLPNQITVKLLNSAAAFNFAEHFLSGVKYGAVFIRGQRLYIFCSTVFLTQKLRFRIYLQA